MPGSYERIYAVVERIPAGKVATYGQVARLAGLGGHARLVGYALHACDRPLPWHRVINARGRISRRRDEEIEELQRAKLEAEGIRFDASGRVSLDRYRWSGAEAAGPGRSDAVGPGRSDAAEAGRSGAGEATSPGAG